MGRQESRSHVDSDLRRMYRRVGITGHLLRSASELTAVVCMSYVFVISMVSRTGRDLMDVDFHLDSTD